MNNQEAIEIESLPKSLTVEDDPYEKSFEDSAIQYFLYRIFLIFCAVGFLQIGKSSLPEDAVPCIEDVVSTALLPVATFFRSNRGFGLTLMSIMQLICDIELVGMVIYWILWAKSFVYPLSVGFLAISKVLINILFKTQEMQNAFKSRAFVSLVFGQNFENTYFFSGITAFLVINLLQFWNYGFKKLFKIQIAIIIYVTFLLISMRLNFFMDIITALAFGYIVYTLFNSKKQQIDNSLLNPKSTIQKWFKNNQEDQISTNPH